MKQLSIFLFFLFGQEILFAQTDHVYIQSLSNLVSLKVGITNEINGFDLTVDDIDYEIYPNTSIHNSYTFSYRFLTLSFSLDPGAVNLNSDTDLRGDTQTIQYGTEFRFKRIVQFLGYNHTDGYYLRNTNNFDATWEKGDPYIQYPDLSYTEFRGITLLKLNPNLSLAALSAPNTRQLKSIGTFIPNLSYRYYSINDQSEILQAGATQRSINFEVSISPGYMHTFVMNERFYFSLGAFPGIGSINTNLVTRTINQRVENSSKTLLYRMALVSGIGFDTGRFYMGSRLVGILNHHTSSDGNATLNQNEMTFEVFAGYRFNAPSFLENTFDWIADVLPFIN